MARPKKTDTNQDKKSTYRTPAQRIESVKKRIASYQAKIDALKTKIDVENANLAKLQNTASKTERTAFMRTLTDEQFQQMKKMFEEQLADK